MPLPTAEFMVTFQDLKRATNSNPEAIGWRSKQQQKVADLVYRLWEIGNRINRQLSLQHQRFTAHVDRAFVLAYREYLERYRDKVTKAAAPIAEAKQKEFDEFIRNFDFSKVDVKKMLEDLSSIPLDVTKYNPAECVDSMLLFVGDAQSAYDDNIEDILSNGLKGWEYFENTIGVNLRELHDRWNDIPHTLIPRHVSAHHGLEIDLPEPIVGGSA